MNNFQLLFSNKLLMAALCGWASGQIIKTIIDSLVNKKVSFERLVGSGGMPSCHSATVCALATSAALLYGLDSNSFAISAILATVVMYDASGVRRETGNQAVIINQIMDFLQNTNPEKPVFSEDDLKELIGHTPLQVFMGAILGIIVGFVFCYSL